MRYYEALDTPELHFGEFAVFLAGGITNCPQWATELRDWLKDVEGLVLINPRRANFPIGDPGAAVEQIEWEFHNLVLSDAISFWFPCETLCPIVLYELGAWAASQKPLAVGVHPEYRRRQDVEVQLRLARPDVRIVYSLRELSHSVRLLMPGK